MTILLAIAILALVGLVVYRDLLWEQRLTKLELERGQEAERGRARYASLQAEAAEERQRHEAERRELYQRIQAPEVAVMESVRESRGERRKARPIAADDDAAFLARDKPERDEVASA